jgi:hypothetical protein
MVERPASDAIAARAPLRSNGVRGVRRAPVNETAPSIEGARDCRRPIYYRWLRCQSTGYVGTCWGVKRQAKSVELRVERNEFINQIKEAGRSEARSPESIITVAGVMDSGLAASRRSGMTRCVNSSASAARGR